MYSCISMKLLCSVFSGFFLQIFIFFLFQSSGKKKVKILKDTPLGINFIILYILYDFLITDLYQISKFF